MTDEQEELKETSFRIAKYKLLINEIELKKVFLEQTIEKETFDYQSINKNINTLIADNDCSLEEINNILCENMKYNCSNIFLDRIQTTLSDVTIETGFNKINQKFNNDYVAVNYHHLLNKKGFNIIDCVSPNKDKEIFFPVLKYNEDYVEIFAFIIFSNSKANDNMRMICININRKTNDVTFYVNGTQGNFKIKNHGHKEITSPTSFYHYLKSEITSYFDLEFEEYTPKKVIEKRKKMFKFCNEMNNLMIGDISDDLSKELSNFISNQISRTFGKMKKMNDKVNQNKIVKKRMNEKIFSAYLGEYITMGYNEDELKEKAKKAGACCYPTKISFKGHELSRGKATARSKKYPLTFETIFYSINTDLSLAGELEEFTVAWFDANFFGSLSEIDTSQTTIKVKNNYFLITMKNTKNKNKGMTTFVQSTIREYLK